MPPRRRRRRRNDADDGSDDHSDDEPQLKAIDRNLPEIVLHDLREWNERLDNLAGEEGTLKSDIFGLTGQYTEGEQRHRAGIDFERHKITQESDIVLVESCDFDSVIATLMGRVPIAPTANFGYLMLADPSSTLTANLKVKVTIDRISGGGIRQEVRVPVHHIPNARFGKMDRFTIYICFPALYDPETRDTSDSPNVVNDNYMEPFYDLAARVAADSKIPQDYRRSWPARYTDELYRTGPLPNAANRGEHVRARQARLHTERIIHGNIFNRWLRKVRKLCEDVPELSFARGFFLLVDGKGFKENALSSHHAPDGPLVNERGHLLDPENPRTTAVEAVLSPYFVTSKFTPGEWYIDLATTVTGHIGHEGGPPVSLFINSDLHPEIINHFSEVPLDVCSRAVQQGNDGYARDEVAHLVKLAGLRKTFDPETEGNGIIDLQVYTSEKVVSYRPDFKAKAIRTSPLLLLKNYKEESERHFKPLTEAYFHAPETHSVVVRFESRIPFELYAHVHFHIRTRIYRRWLLYIRNTVFWGFKWRRLNAIWNILDMICDANKARSQFGLDQLCEVGSLLILLVYMANALVNRPDDGGHFDEIHDAGCVHEIVNYELVPVTRLGYYTIHSLHIPRPQQMDFRLPRISSQRTASRKTIIYLLSSEEKERTELHALRLFRNERRRPADDTNQGDAWGLVPQKQQIIYPHTSNKQRVNISLPDEVSDVFADTLPDQELRVVYSSEDEDNEVRERAPKLSAQVSTIVYTFPVQIIAKVPNRKKGLGSWCRLSADERADADFDLFCDASAPARIFTSWNNFGRDGGRWDSTVAAYFPTRSVKLQMGLVQGLSQMSVWEDWNTALSRLAPDSEAKTVKRTRKYVSEHWKWLPYYTKKKLWVTGASPTTTICRKVGPDEGGPWIVFNPRFLH